MSQRPLIFSVSSVILIFPQLHLFHPEPQCHLWKNKRNTMQLTNAKHSLFYVDKFETPILHVIYIEADLVEGVGILRPQSQQRTTTTSLWLR